MTADLLVIVPSRGRPENIARLWEAWQDTATGRAYLLVCIDEDDPAEPEYVAHHRHHLRRYMLSTRHRNGFAPRLNDEARLAADPMTRADPFALASWGDDHVPHTHGWDAALVDALHELGTGYAYGNDLFQGPNIPTAWAQTSDIVRTLGWMTPPPLAHLYVDNAVFDLGHAIGRIRYLPEVIIEHLHPATGKVEWDQLTADANSGEAYETDRVAYEKWRAEDLDRDAARILMECVA